MTDQMESPAARYRYAAPGARARQSLPNLDTTYYLPGLTLRHGKSRRRLCVRVSGSDVELHRQAGRAVSFAMPLRDHLDSSGLTLDDRADVLAREAYYPFGGTALWAVRCRGAARRKVIRHAGQERDSTGLYAYAFRYYAPWLGRWLSADPAGPVDGLNLFSMVRNNPMTLRDPNGLAADEVERYLTRTEQNLAANHEPRSVDNVRDRQVLPDLVAAERRRTGQDLRFYNTLGEFAQALHAQTIEAGAMRYQAVVAMTDRPDGGAHFAAFDVRRRALSAEAPLSMVYVEPSFLVEEQVAEGAPDFFLTHDAVGEGYRTLFREYFPRTFGGLGGGPAPKTSVVFSAAQKSPFDCAIFSLSFALKMRRAEAFFDQLHDSNDNRAEGLQHFFGEQILLPPSFYRHAHSRATVDMVAAAWQTRDPDGVTALRERHEQSRITRGARRFSNSIERKRVALLSRALRY